MKKRIGLLVAMLACSTMCSCSNVRVYKPYGNYLTAEQVRDVCVAYGGRYASITAYLGLYRGNTHVLLMKSEIPGVGFDCAVHSFYAADIYICDANDGSGSLVVWVEGEGVYGIQKAYEEGKISEEEIRSAADEADQLGIRRYGHVAVPLEKFTFSLTWGVGFDSSYNSKTGTLIKTDKVINRSPEEYVTTFEYPNIESLYEKVKLFALYQYPSTYDPYEGVTISTNPKTNYKLTIDDKTIEARNCPIIEGYPEGLTWSGKEFLELVFEIRDTIQNSDEWKALPDYEVLYK